MTQKLERAEQLAINRMVEQHFQTAIKKYRFNYHTVKPLRKCSAAVIETEHYYILRSYRTYIAVIHKGSDTLFDYLRGAYGYTATSAQHIRKFSQDYGRGKYGCERCYTWRDV